MTRIKGEGISNHQGPDVLSGFAPHERERLALLRQRYPNYTWITQRVMTDSAVLFHTTQVVDGEQLVIPLTIQANDLRLNVIASLLTSSRDGLVYTDDFREELRRRGGKNIPSKNQFQSLNAELRRTGFQMINVMSHAAGITGRRYLKYVGVEAIEDRKESFVRVNDISEVSESSAIVNFSDGKPVSVPSQLLPILMAIAMLQQYSHEEGYLIREMIQTGVLPVDYEASDVTRDLFQLNLLLNPFQKRIHYFEDKENLHDPNYIRYQVKSWFADPKPDVSQREKIVTTSPSTPPFVGREGQEVRRIVYETWDAYSLGKMLQAAINARKIPRGIRRFEDALAVIQANMQIDTMYLSQKATITPVDKIRIYKMLFELLETPQGIVFDEGMPPHVADALLRVERHFPLEDRKKFLTEVEEFWGLKRV